jgi:hypothetical protein
MVRNSHPSSAGNIRSRMMRSGVRPVAQAGQRLLAVRGRDYLVPFVLEEKRDDGQDLPVVLDDQDSPGQSCG